MSVPSEPEKYSIDEMMESLKTRSSEEPVSDGELVTREDGSQAIRIRKRKRRSQQPKKEGHQQQRRVRMIQVSGALILLLLGLLGAGAAIIFANSPPFRENLLKNIALSTGASAELQQFRMNPTQANASGLILNWPEGNVLRDFTARGVRAEIFPVSFLGKSMVGQEATISEATLTLRTPRIGKASREVPATTEILPIRFNLFTIPKFHVLLGDPATPLVRLMNSEGYFHPVNASGRSQVLLNRGEITLANCPKLQMDRSHIEFRGSEVDIVAMRLRHESDLRGCFELSGTISPFAVDRVSTLAVRMDAYPLVGITGLEMGRLISGKIDTLPTAKSNFLSFKPEAPADAILSIAFGSAITSKIELSGFPFLWSLSQILEDDWFEHPVFESNANGVLRRANGSVSFSDLNFANKGRIALRGNVTMASGGALSGALEVGIAEAMVKASRNSKLDALFASSKDGFRWITLNLGGNVANPTDNFNALFESVVVPKPPPPAKAVPTFEELTPQK